jgi:hypothetical protein
VLLAGGSAGWTAVAQVAMTLACLPCAVHLWRRPGPVAWAMHTALALAMLVAHPLAVVLGGHVHQHVAAAAEWAGTAVPLLGGLALFLAVYRWWLGYDVAAPGSSGIGSARRVPHA